MKTLAGDLIWTRIERRFASPAGWELGTDHSARRDHEVVNQPALLQRRSIFYRYADVTPTGSAFRIKTAAVPFWWWNVPVIVLALGAATLLVRRFAQVRVETAR